jgi:hypothetical protein
MLHLAAAEQHQTGKGCPVSESRMNCWEYQQCGRERGGWAVGDDGPCPASTALEADGVHGGIKGGRMCWAVEGTLCEGCSDWTPIQKRAYCTKCAFYRRVQIEEGIRFDTSLLLPEVEMNGTG